MRYSISIIVLLFLFESCNNAFFRESVNTGSVERQGTPQQLKIINKNGLVLLPIEIGDDIYHFILDTGAGVSAIDSQLAAQLQLEKLRSAPVGNASNQRQKFDFVSVKELKISHLLFLNTIAITEDFSNFPIEVSNFGGIIGQPIIAKANWKIDLKNKTLDVSDTAFLSETMTSIPYEIGDNRLPYISINIEGEKQKILLDTGCSDMLNMSNRTTISRKLMNKYPVKIHELEVYTLGQQRTVIIKELKLPQLILGNSLPIEDVFIRFDNINDQKLGMPMFKNKTLVINPSRQEIGVSR